MPDHSLRTTWLKQIKLHSVLEHEIKKKEESLKKSIIYNLQRNKSHIWDNLGAAQSGIKIAGRNINNLRYADENTLMSESEEGLKCLLMKMKEESEKVGLKFSIQKLRSCIWSHRFMANRGGNNGNSETIFLDSKITADGDCSHEIKRSLLLGRKAVTNVDSILKTRDNTLLTKVQIVKALVFPAVIYGCESWTIKKAEH